MEVQSALDKLYTLYRENKLSHAYLIETNDMDKCYEDLLLLIKKIACNSTYSEKCEKCNLCNLIDQNLLPSFIVIEPDGINIKKEQVLELKRKFSMIPVYTENNIYVIKNADKLNSESANTMLKFIEEPNDKILGFFITKNINNVIDTIRSRCEILSLFYKNDEDIISNKEHFEVAKDYIQKTEVEKEEKILYNKSVILNSFSERKDIELIFKIMLYIYESFYQEKTLLKDNKFKEEFLYLSNLNLESLLKRINLLTTILDDINSNVNIELLLDRYVIELSDMNG